MKKRFFALLTAAMLICLTIFGCGSDNTDETTASETAKETVTTEEETTTETEATTETEEAVLEDGVYLADFTTDNSMFHVNETKDGKGILTVENGQMTIHIVLTSENIVNLYQGVVADVESEDAEVLDPVEEEVTYDDGYTEMVNAFDLPVPVLDEEFDCALLGKKGTWYDHKVIVSNPVPYTEDEETDGSDETENAGTVLEDGVYTMEVSLEGGSGKASVESPAKVVIEDGEIMAIIVWSSPYYDYMMIGEDEYLPVNTEGNSTFDICVDALDVPIAIQADTTAMSTPHLIDYTLTFDSSTAVAE